MAEIRIGAVRLEVPALARGVLPAGRAPAGLAGVRLPGLSTVELNATYCRLPGESTFAGRQRRSPPSFLSAVIASRVISHLKRLAHVEAEVEQFLSRARLLDPPATAPFRHLRMHGEEPEGNYSP